MKILFCSDGSQCSLNSFKNVTKFINSATVDIICVIDWSFLPDTMNMDKDSFSLIYDNIADSVLNYSAKIIKEQNFEVGNKIKSFGSPSDEILETLEQTEYDLVVLGSHGKKGFQKWIGSVSSQVLSKTTIPCFISKTEVQGEKILITTDGSDCSMKYIKKFIDITNLNDKHIILLIVKESPEYYPIDVSADKNWYDSIEAEQRVYATKTLNKAKSLFDNANIEIDDEIILTGNAAHEIIDYCNKEKIDLVLLGSRKRNDLSKILLGSVSKRVIENVGCATLVIGCK
ncbi:universal stress protein [bacterium]|nr:universal stress protein [bacterium]